jgi:histidine triad (HIT) family protein
MLRDSNCIFCKIVAGEIPSSPVLETDLAIVILDIHPVAKGHLLIVPREHHPLVRDLPDKLAAHVGSLLPRLSRALEIAVGATGSNTVINSGRVAGQEIDHCHWHLIPRSTGDAIRWPWPRDSYSSEEMGRTASRIIAELS